MYVTTTLAFRPSALFSTFTPIYTTIRTLLHPGVGRWNGGFEWWFFLQEVNRLGLSMGHRMMLMKALNVCVCDGVGGGVVCEGVVCEAVERCCVCV